MSTFDREEGADEPNASKSIEGDDKGKSIDDKVPLDPVSMSKRNEITPNGSKRKRKDWRAFASENGGARRRVLRSDVARLHAETEARGGRNGFKHAELEGMDWVKCGDDLQVANEKVNKESSVSGNKVTKIGETEHLGNGELGVGERKEGDDAANGVAGSDFPSEEELVGKRKGVTGDEVTACAVSDKSVNENIRREIAEVDASCENSKGAIKIETMNVEAGSTDLQRGKTVEAEQFNVLKKAKKKLFSGKRSTPVQVESVTVERRITRSSAAKQMVNQENALEIEGAAIVEGQMEEESSGLDQTDTDDNKLLKNFKLKKSKKTRSDRRKSSDLTDSDEEFNPVRKRVRKKHANAEVGKDFSSASGTKRNRQKKPEVESEEPDSSGSNSEFLVSDVVTSAMKKRQGRPPGSKHKTGKAKFGKMIKTKKKKQAGPLGAKNKEKVIKVESMSELDDKPRRVAKEIVRDMIKDLLKKHGWTIELRPRYGREYMDQVHVSPDGTTHWSITKAYYAFLRERESLQSPSKGKGKQVTDFTPISEELLDILKKTVCKERCDAKKKKNKLKGKTKEKGKWRLGVKSKKIKKKGKLKKKIKKEGEKSASSGINEMNPKRGRKKKARLTLLARGSHKEGEASGENDYVPYEWKRTVVSWMIDLEVVSENGKIKYIDPNKPDPLAEGKIIRDGIECDCCAKTFTVSDFVVHAAVAENGTSCLSYLFVEEVGLNFLQCLVRAWEKQCSISEPKGFFSSAEADGVDQNDDTCGVCGDGGKLVCCDECPSTFHLTCLGMEMLPSGDWHCPYCSCSFCKKLSSSPLLSCTQCSDKCTCY